MALQSSGQISLFDVVLEHRPNNTTVGSGLKPFRLANYNSYSTSVYSPLRLKEFYGTGYSYDTSRYDDLYNSGGSGGVVSITWAASVGDIKEIKLAISNYTPEPGSEKTLSISLTNGGTYKLRYEVPSTGSGANFSIGYSSNVIYGGAGGSGFFGPFTNSSINLSATSGSSDLINLYARIIRIA